MIRFAATAPNKVIVPEDARSSQHQAYKLLVICFRNFHKIFLPLYKINDAKRKDFKLFISNFIYTKSNFW
jgi:hypothetical protein